MYSSLSLQSLVVYKAFWMEPGVGVLFGMLHNGLILEMSLQSKGCSLYTSGRPTCERYFMIATTTTEHQDHHRLEIYSYTGKLWLLMTSLTNCYRLIGSRVALEEELSRSSQGKKNKKNRKRKCRNNAAIYGPQEEEESKKEVIPARTKWRQVAAADQRAVLH
ncbi:hypothetical protein COLO4_29148 [Corchorus olitorius]|uniref:Uncharacterized protein n=1 Tax=Corchorus olitorius TaxID=93759 RepID=A0A1R3HG56_9ROSI|nr:hypothetical protein COLO4_29148 [Corchorus olitorius]